MSVVLFVDKVSYCIRLILDFLSDLTFRVLPCPYANSLGGHSRTFKRFGRERDAERLLQLSAVKLAEKIRKKEVRRRYYLLNN